MAERIFDAAGFDRVATGESASAGWPFRSVLSPRTPEFGRQGVVDSRHVLGWFLQAADAALAANAPLGQPSTREGDQLELIRSAVQLDGPVTSRASLIVEVDVKDATDTSLVLSVMVVSAEGTRPGRGELTYRLLRSQA